jgi:SNF family Na+-dependent transporter
MLLQLKKAKCCILSCVGPVKGDGPAAANLNPKPKDFSSVELQKQTDGELFWKLSNGKGMMVPYKHSLNEEKRWQLINYIRTLSVK